MQNGLRVNKQLLVWILEFLILGDYWALVEECTRSAILVWIEIATMFESKHI